ncbi:hypothetical protein NKH18_31700 [Streptomyces sp. M10(2022)]
MRGRLLMRPVAAVTLFFCQVPLRRGFRSAVDQAADQWNAALGDAPPEPRRTAGRDRQSPDVLMS